MDVVSVDLGDRSYEVRIGPGLLEEAPAQIRPLLTRAQVFVVTEAHVADLHLQTLQTALETAGIGVELMASPSACRTYNVLLAENRRVAVALIAV